MSSEDGTLENAPTEPVKSMLEFTAAGSTANAHMMFSHMLKKEKCRAFPSKGMITALYGGNLLALDDAQGLGFTVFGLPSSSQAESSGEEDLLKNQINATDGQGIGKDGVEKLAETKLSLIYNFADMRNRTNSLVASYEHITGPNSYTVKKLNECRADIINLETELTRGQNKNSRYMSEIYYTISKKLTMFTESCRDAEDDRPLVVRHLNFTRLWEKVELGESMDIALPPCLQRLFKGDNRFRNIGRHPPQDQYGGGGDYYGPPGGAGDPRKRGRPRYNENPEDKGEVVHNEYPSKCIAISKQDFAPLVHNFIKLRDNKK